MFESNILDVGVGLLFTFLAISLVTSTTTEALASAFGWRANTLLQGIKDLLNDPNFDGLARDIYNHGLANPQSDGQATNQAALTAKPSYVDSRQFAAALIDVVGISPGVDIAGLKSKIKDEVTDPQLKMVLDGIVDRTGGNINRIRDEISCWFDSEMDRVSGAYKRRTQIWSFALGLLLAIVLNLDAIKIAEALWNQPMLIKGISPTPGQTAVAALGQLSGIGLPMGWDQGAVARVSAGYNWIYAAVGWLICAVATLFGAPFWFDTLQKFVQLRGAGSK
jgi:hypothetical protein